MLALSQESQRQRFACLHELKEHIELGGREPLRAKVFFHSPLYLAGALQEGEQGCVGIAVRSLRLHPPAVSLIHM